MLSLNLDPSAVGRDRSLTVWADVGLTEEDVDSLRSSVDADQGVPFLAAPVDTNVPELQAVILVTPDGMVHFQVSEVHPADRPDEVLDDEHPLQTGTFEPADSSALVGGIASTAKRSRHRFSCSASAEFVRADYGPLVSLPWDLWSPGSFPLGKMIGARFQYTSLRQGWVAFDSAHDESRFTVQLNFAWRGALTPESLERLWSTAFAHMETLVRKVPDDSEAN